MKNILLKRKVLSNTRYYNISISKTLFDTYIVERIYGNITYKKPTGKKVEYFSNLEKANLFFNTMLAIKIKKGYLQI